MPLQGLILKTCVSTHHTEFSWAFQTDNTYANRVSNVTSAHDPAVFTCQLSITKVTFTVVPNGHRMGTWFGSSGGGLPKDVLSVTAQGVFFARNNSDRVGNTIIRRA